ncbi:MAG: ATP-binding cassette domain-containing protein [Myxococcota bacterium]
MSVIEVERLERTWGAARALDGVTFRVERGEIVGLLGPNGAGKTTTMKILTGQLAPTAGSARVAGHDVLLAPIEARRAIGYLPEGAPLYDEMTAGGYLRFVARARGLGPAEAARALERTATACGLTDRLGQGIATLSRGYRQRVGLAAALVHDPPILVLDEPTTGLDPNQVVEIRALVRAIGATRTVILSTHVLPEVEVTCDRVLILHRGRLVADDRTAAIVASTRGQLVQLGLAAGKVRVRPEVVAAELGAVPGVGAVRAIAGEALRFEVEADRDVRADLFRWAVDHGHVLVELTLATRNLEDVFRQLTEVA